MPERTKRKLGIVDDHQIFRDGVISLLSDNFLFPIEAFNGEDFFNQMELLGEDQYPDLVIVDINMPVMNGFETTRYLKKSYPNIKVLALTMSDSPDSVIGMINRGADSFLTKNVGRDELIQAINETLKFGSYYPNWVATILVKAMRGKRLDDPGDELTPREVEFIKLCVTDLSYPQIADRMNIKPRTVDTFRDNIFRKLNVNTRVSLAMYAIKHNLISITENG